MKAGGFRFDYRIVSGFSRRGILTINDDQRFAGRRELLTMAAWFVRAALFPRREGS